MNVLSATKFSGIVGLTSGAPTFSGVLTKDGGIVASGALPLAGSRAAESLARVFGTEEDPVNCSWFFKVGACRKGDSCPKRHNAPTSSESILLSAMYSGTPESTAIANEMPWDDAMYDRAQKHLETFYVDVFLTVAEYGEVEEVVVLDNTTPNLMGNVYVKYYREESAAKALRGLTGRHYNGNMLFPEFTPVADFREARCRTHHEKRCRLVGMCGFMHMKHIPRALKRRVVRHMYKAHPEYADKGGRGNGDVPDEVAPRDGGGSLRDIFLGAGQISQRRDGGKRRPFTEAGNADANGEFDPETGEPRRRRRKGRLEDDGNPEISLRAQMHALLLEPADEDGADSDSEGTV